MFKFFVLFVALSTAYGALLYANLGDNVTLPCSYASSAEYLSWYKQVAGEQPEIISSFYKHLPESNNFYNQFKDNKRFSVLTGERFYHLNISNVQHLDSAMYFCGETSVTVTKFYKGIFVVFKESSQSSFLQQPLSTSVQPGGSVTLNCTVHTGTCDDGEHSVYWFKNSEESHPGIIYTHGGRNDQCERKPNTQTHTCVYNLPMKSVNVSHAGTYYCAVASCGRILFGNGTKLDFEQEVDPFILVYILIGALTYTTILVVFLPYAANTMSRSCCKCRDSQARSPAASTPESYKDADNRLYAASRGNKAGISRRQRDDTWTECVYSCVKK